MFLQIFKKAKQVHNVTALTRLSLYAFLGCLLKNVAKGIFRGLEPPTIRTYSRNASKGSGGARLHHLHLRMARQGVLFILYFGMVKENLWLIHHAVW